MHACGIRLGEQMLLHIDLKFIFTSALIDVWMCSLCAHNRQCACFVENCENLVRVKEVL